MIPERRLRRDFARFSIKKAFPGFPGRLRCCLFRVPGLAGYWYKKYKYDKAKAKNDADDLAQRDARNQPSFCGEAQASIPGRGVRRHWGKVWHGLAMFCLKEELGQCGEPGGSPKNPQTRLLKYARHFATRITNGIFFRSDRKSGIPAVPRIFTGCCVKVCILTLSRRLG